MVYKHLIGLLARIKEEDLSLSPLATIGMSSSSSEEEEEEEDDSSEDSSDDSSEEDFDDADWRRKVLI